MVEKPFLVEHENGVEKRWCIEENEVSFLSPTSQFNGFSLLELGAPPAWMLKKTMWKRVSQENMEGNSSTSNNTQSLKLPLFSKFKDDLNNSLRENDDPVLKQWFMAGACKMLSIIKSGNFKHLS